MSTTDVTVFTGDRVGGTEPTLIGPVPGMTPDDGRMGPAAAFDVAPPPA